MCPVSHYKGGSGLLQLNHSSTTWVGPKRVCSVSVFVCVASLSLCAGFDSTRCRSCYCCCVNGLYALLQGLGPVQKWVPACIINSACTVQATDAVSVEIVRPCTDQTLILGWFVPFCMCCWRKLCAAAHGCHLKYALWT